MFFQLDLVCFYFYFLLQIIYVTAFTTKIGHFKIFKRNRQINQCASKLFRKNEVNGLLRVSESTRQCKTISASWDEENFETGYNYAKLFIVKDSFHPPKSLGHDEALTLNSSIGPLTAMNLYLTWPKITWDTIMLQPNEHKVAGGWEHTLIFLIRDIIKRIRVFELLSNAHLDRYYDDDLPGTNCKISFTASGNDTIKVLFNEKPMVTWKVQEVRFNRLGGIKINYREEHAVNGRLLPIHGVEFISQG